MASDQALLTKSSLRDRNTPKGVGYAAGNARLPKATSEDVPTRQLARRWDTDGAGGERWTMGVAVVQPKVRTTGAR